MAAAIAVGGFVAHARPAIEGKSEDELRRLTAAGGICGLSIAIGLIIVGRLL